jgi:HEPN domain-containing protein
LSEAEFEFKYLDTAFSLASEFDEMEIYELSIRVPPRIYRTLSSYQEEITQIEEAIAELSQHTTGVYVKETRWTLRMPKLEEVEASPETDEIFADSSLYDVQRLWTKAKARSINDPDGAITASKTMLESLCKILISEAKGTYTNTDDLPQLYKKATTALKFSPDSQINEEYRKLAGACSTITNAVSAIRNRESDSHATGNMTDHLRAKFVVNIAGSIVTYLIGLRSEKMKEQKKAVDEPKAG